MSLIGSEEKQNTSIRRPSLYSCLLTCNEQSQHNFLHSGFPFTKRALIWFVLNSNTIRDQFIVIPHSLVHISIPLCKTMFLGHVDLKPKTSIHPVEDDVLLFVCYKLPTNQQQGVYEHWIWVFLYKDPSSQPIAFQIIYYLDDVFLWKSRNQIVFKIE